MAPPGRGGGLGAAGGGMARPLAADAALVGNVPGLADNLAGIAAVRALPPPLAPSSPLALRRSSVN